MSDNITPVIEATEQLTDEELNRYVDWLRAHMKDRANRRNAKARAQLQVGTRVRFAGRFKPQYVQGLTGEVVEIRQSRVVVLFDKGPIGKFKSGKIITPASALEVIS